MPAVLYERDGHIVTITLNRPGAMNALNRQLSEELRVAFEQFNADDEARVAILTGAGDRAFSAGADLKEMSVDRSRLAPTPGEVLGARPAGLRSGVGNSPKPVIAAINGYCLAGGLETALACDIRIAAEHAKFGLTEVTRGIIAGGGGTQRLPRAIPLSMAMEMLLTGRHIDAQEALAAGLVSRVVPAASLMEEARKTAGLIAANAPLAVRATKESVMRGLQLPLEEALRLESVLLRLCAESEDAREGPLAFAEKRPPQWKGR